jgi:hypothetical protein
LIVQEIISVNVNVRKKGLLKLLHGVNNWEKEKTMKQRKPQSLWLTLFYMHELFQPHFPPSNHSHEHWLFLLFNHFPSATNTTLPKI